MKLIYVTISLLYLTLSKGQISDSINKFTIDLLEKTLERNAESNVALSPYTIWSLLTVTSVGARFNTATQLRNVLGISEHNPDFLKNYKELSWTLLENSIGTQLENNNILFVNSPIKLKKTFVTNAYFHYATPIQKLNFMLPNEASGNINSYVQEKTHNRIKNFVSVDDVKNAQLLLTSLLYFKGEWEIPFNKSLTHSGNFFDEKGQKIAKVDLMNLNEEVGFARIEELNAYSLELKYGTDGKTSMLILLPFKGSTVKSMASLLKQTSIKNILEKIESDSIEFSGEKVNVTLPKFKISSKLDLKDILNDMGIIDLFDESKADLQAMTSNFKNLYVSRIFQNAEIEVNEEGTEAAAATGSTLVFKTFPSSFVANRPFLYFIVNKATNTILFAGKVANPQLSS